MKATRAILMTAMSLSLLLVGCTGRTAAWEAEKAAKEAAGDSGAAGELKAQAEAHWAKRTDPEEIKQAIAAWEKAVALDPSDYQSLTSITRGLYFLADGYLRGDDEAYLDTMDQGVAWGEKAMMAVSSDFEKRMRDGEKLETAIEAIGVEGVGALYWYATNLGKWAKKKGFAVLLGNKDKVKAIMERCLKLDPTYFHGAPDRYFGAFYAVAPKFAGGDLEKSAQHYAKSLELAPYYIGTRVLMAENLAVKKQDRALFDEQLEAALEVDENAVPEIRPEVLVEKKKAEELQKNADELF
ncbi:MAG: TRAP transporter TatT component family protein [Deltaproteobacteria bacterium]|nr:TRAP transporter TatT component family protein [Deltaproteobacteria bacterium]